MAKTRTYYVARNPSDPNLYAAKGEYVGMGYSALTQSPLGSPGVFKSKTIEGLMYAIGGHYAGYHAVKVEEVVERKFGDPEPWADPDEVWDS